MNETRGKRNELFVDAASGLASGLLYLSFLLSFAFLVPVQRSVSGRGRKSGAVAAGFSALCIAVGQGLRLSSYGVFDLGLCLAAVLPPLLLLGALLALDFRFWGLELWVKVFLFAVALTCVAAPFVLSTTGDKAFTESLRAYVGATVEGAGLDAGAMEEVDQAIAQAVTTLRAAVAPIFFWFLGLSWLAGSWLAAKAPALNPDERGRRLSTLRLQGFKVPHVALWPTLAAWAILFVALAARLGALPTAVAWNLALLSASLYAVQGLGIIGYLSERYPAGRLLRLLLPLAAILVVLAPKAGAIVMAALPILGITEVWFPYRNFKGALK